MWLGAGIPLPVLLSLSPFAPAANELVAPALEPASEPLTAVASVQEESKSWSFAVRPYLWAASIDGTLTVSGLGSADFEADFSDIVEDLDFAWMINLEARAPGGDFGFLLDSVYIDLAGSTDALDWEHEQRMLELDLTWRVLEKVSLFTGARYVDIESGLSDPSSMLAIASEEDWVDPIVGARGHHAFGEHWILAGRGDVGGFGAGSELSWQLQTYLLFRASRVVDLGLGYRYLDIRYEEGAGETEVELSGPVLGAGFRF